MLLYNWKDIEVLFKKVFGVIWKILLWVALSQCLKMRVSVSQITKSIDHLHGRFFWIKGSSSKISSIFRAHKGFQFVLLRGLIIIVWHKVIKCLRNIIVRNSVSLHIKSFCFLFHFLYVFIFLLKLFKILNSH